MDFLKKHYEKALLGVVLLGLVVAAAFLPLMIAGERQSLEEKVVEVSSRQTKSLPAPSLSRQEDLLKRAEKPLSLDLSTTNKLFNPMQWQRAPDGHLVKLPAGGPVDLCQVTKITPLYTILTLDSVQTNQPIRYVIGIERLAALTATQRRKYSTAVALNEKSKEKDGFSLTLRQVKGPPDDPTELVLELNDSTNRVSLAKDKPFKREDDYLADLKYDGIPGKWSRSNLRKGDLVAFGGESYIIVYINKNEVVLLAKSNNKKTPIQYNPGP